MFLRIILLQLSPAHVVMFLNHIFLGAWWIPGSTPAMDQGLSAPSACLYDGVGSGSTGDVRVT